MDETRDPRHEEYLRRVREVHHLGAGMGVLGWDQEVNLPPGGVMARAQQRAALATVIHERTVAAELGELIEALSVADLDAYAKADLREMKRQRDRAVKIPTKLVASKAEAESLAQQAWVTARRDDSWPTFEPHLARLLELKREEAEAVGYDEEAYDALLDEFEPGARVRELSDLFADLRGELQTLLEELKDSAAAERSGLLKQSCDVAAQAALSRRVLEDIGFDFERGRLDVSTHPFTQGLAPGDVRLTTRFADDNLVVGLYASLHEGGHALYEQGLPAEHAATAVGQAISLGIHESQSRLWENLVGRSRPFMSYLRPLLAEYFPDQFDGVTGDELYRAANVIAPGAIRIEADEVTYNLHIVLRMELERALVRGEIAVAEVPGLWREGMEDYLGVTVNTDSEGALQDIHWAFGVFGYFPTYTLGNLYSAQIFDAARSALPDLQEQIGRGEFGPLRTWLGAEIHARGSLLVPEDLCREVTGRPLETEAYLAYLRAKYGKLGGAA